MASLIAPEQADPVADAEALMKACKGWGTDEKGVISVICHRNAAQIKMIKKVFQQLYNEDLLERLHKELSGNFQKAVHLWMLDPSERGASIMHHVLMNSDYRVIIELSCLSSAEELIAIKQAYQDRYKHSLEEDVASYFSGDMRMLLLLLVSVHRHEIEVSDPKLVEVEAKILHNCIKDKVYNHEEIIRILTTRSKVHLISTFYRFGDVYGTSITEILDSDRDQDFVSALQAIIRCIKCPAEYLEQVLSDALLNHGTNVEALTRVIVTRAEKDLGDIKELFYKRHSRTLEHVVIKETHWDYETFLLALLGKQDY